MYTFVDMDLLETVPKRLQESWTTVPEYDWITAAKEGTPEHTDALKWELLLHKILLPLTKRTKGKKKKKTSGTRKDTGDSATVRIQLFLQGGYQKLIRKVSKHADSAKTHTRIDSDAPTVNRKLWIRYNAHRNLSLWPDSPKPTTLLSKGMGDLSDPHIISQIVCKHPAIKEDIPVNLPAKLPQTRLTVKLMERYSRTEPVDYHNEYLRCLPFNFIDSLAKQVIARHEGSAELYLNASLPSWYYFVLGSLEMVALIKAEAESRDAAPDVRPIGVGDCQRRAWLSQLMHEEKDMLRETLYPQQVSVGVPVPDGQLLIHTSVNLHMSLPEHTHYVVGEVYISNAYNELCWAAMLQEVSAHLKWRKLYRTLWCIVCPHRV